MVKTMDLVLNNYLNIKSQLSYWETVYDIAKSTLIEDRDMNALELNIGICAATVANKSQADFVADYWRAYWVLNNED